MTAPTKTVTAPTDLAISSQRTGGDYLERVTRLADRLRAAYDTQPVERAEWDAASGDEADFASDLSVNRDTKREQSR